MGMAPGVLPGRVSLEQGRDWFTDHWGSVPMARGRDTTEALRSLVAGGRRGPRGRWSFSVPIPWRTFRTGRWPPRPSRRPRWSIAVAGHPGPALDHADVVLPVAVAHERPGTTTNVEGRVTRLGQKLVPPGLAWPDWIIAAALSDELGYDLAIGTVGRHRRRGRAGRTGLPRLRAGVLGPGLRATTGSWCRSGRPRCRPVDPIDPMATPGVESVERQGAPPRVGLTDPLSRDLLAALHPDEGADDAPALLRRPSPAAVSVPAPDHYSLRLVSTRRLYDNGAAVVGVTVAGRAGPLGGGPGQPLGPGPPRRGSGRPGAGHLSSWRAHPCGSGTTPACPRVCWWSSSTWPSPRTGPTNAAAVLIDASAVVNEVRLETL